MHIPQGFGTVTYFWARVGDTEEMVTSLGFNTLGDPPTDEDADLMFEAWSESDMRTSTTIQTSLVRVEYAVATTGDNELVVAESTLPGVAGGTNSDTTPSNCAILIRKRSGLPGRKNQGRIFYPDCQAEAVNQNGLLGDENRGNYQAALIDWFGTLSGIGVLDGPVILHTDPADTPTPVTQVIVQNQLATQRRRMRP